MKGYLAGAALVLIGAAVAAAPLVGRVQERRAQASLLGQFEAARQPSAATPAATAAATPPAPSAPEVPFRLEIPAVGISEMVLDGLDDEHLAQGPAHYAETPLPGPQGNAAIAGHRTVRGQPSFFYALNKVKPGDTITVTYTTQTLTYIVERVFITDAYDRTVLAPTADATLTLTTCDPPGTADQRLIVRARLDPASAR